MIWSIVCEWNYSSWCVVFWVWITSRIENCYFFLVVSKIRFAMFQKTLKLLDDFDEYFWIFVSIYRFLLVLKYYLSTRITKEKQHHHHSSSTSNSMQVFMQWLDLVISTINTQQHFISNQHSTRWTTTTTKFDSIGLSYKNIKDYNIIDKIVFYRLDHSTFIKWRRDESKIQREKTNRRKHIKWNCEIFVIIVK